MQRDKIPGDHFFHCIGAQGINAGQVHDLHIGILRRVFPAAEKGRAEMGAVAMVMMDQRARLLFYRHPRPIAHMLIGAGEPVEKRGFSAVLVARQGKYVMLHAHSSCRMIWAASALRSVRE